MTAAPKELSSTLQKLSLHPTPSKSASSFAKPQSQPPDSWEDEELEGSGEELDRPISPQQSADYPSAPPPTPISPSVRDAYISPYGYGTDGAADVYTPDGRERERGGGKGRGDLRPEKTDAVAKRMIAGALGVRAPKKTEEQRAYDRAVKEKEIKRRNREREDEVRAKEEAETARVKVWED